MRYPLFQPAVVALALACLVAGGAAPAAAQAIEITPFAGYRFGGGLTADDYSPYDPDLYADFDLEGNPSFGVIVDVAVSSRFKVEGLISHQRTYVDLPGFFAPKGPPIIVDQYAFGAQWEFGQRQLRPFLSGLLGFTRYAPDAEGAGSETRFGFSIGGGLKAFLSEHYGLRFDGRASTQFGSTGSGIYCGFGGCGFSIGGWGTWSGEVTAGVIFAF